MSNESFRRLEGETSSSAATLAAIQKQIAASKGVEATVSGHLNDMRESLAVTDGKKRALENKVDDVNSTLRSRESELREVERLLGVAKARREVLERESVRVERDVKEKRQLENELHVLRSSRDLAAGEAMKAEEEDKPTNNHLFNRLEEETNVWWKPRQGSLERKDVPRFKPDVCFLLHGHLTPTK